ncbi:MAG: hypothetical protein JNM51_09845 [Bacteroidia bacterium]|nr:hypothetical protein [Bacteroidia bacterium]
MKSKKILLTIIFTALISIVRAQDKYEYMIIEFDTFKDKISVSIDGKEFITEKVDHGNQERSAYNANPFLLKVKEYQDKDWDVMSFNSSADGNIERHFAHLRKKMVVKN